MREGLTAKRVIPTYLTDASAVGIYLVGICRQLHIRQLLEVGRQNTNRHIITKLDKYLHRYTNKTMYHVRSRCNASETHRDGRYGGNYAEHRETRVTRLDCIRGETGPHETEFPQNGLGKVFCKGDRVYLK
jgi:hypothetical protein